MHSIECIQLIHSFTTALSPPVLPSSDDESGEGGGANVAAIVGMMAMTFVSYPIFAFLKF